MLNDNDIVITRQQLEAWASAISIAMEASYGQPKIMIALGQALEDMTDELTDPDEIDIIEDADLYDPDSSSDGWHGEEE